MNKGDFKFLIGRAHKQNYVDQGSVLTSVICHGFIFLLPTIYKIVLSFLCLYS